MDGARSKQRRTYRGLVAFLLSLASMTAGAQTTDTATVDFDPERVVIGRTFTLQLRTSIPWGEEVRISRPELEGPMVWWAYPYARPWTVAAEDGRTVRMIEVLAAIRVDAPGFHVIGPFRIQAGDREAVTPAKEVIGLKADEADLPYPVFTQWRTRPARVWQGQAVPVILEARNLVSLALADTAVLNSAPQGLLEEAPGLGGINTRPHGNDILYDVPMASWIWTQTGTGTFNFPGVRISVAGLERSSPGFPVEVLPVPESALASGAVGRFRVDMETEEGPYHAGEIVSVRIRVEGEGNMNVLNPPVPEFEGANLVGQSSTSSYLPGPLGFEGWREERYDFQVESAGDMELGVPGWVWFDPEGEGSVRRVSPSSRILKIEEQTGEGEAEEHVRLLGDGLFRYPAAKFTWRVQHWFLLALPGSILLVVMFLLRRPGHKVLAAVILIPLFMSASSIDSNLLLKASDAASHGDSGNWENAETGYLSILAEAGESPGLLHDLSIVEMELGRTDMAVSLMRRALLLRPGSSQLTESLRILENRLTLDDQVPVPLRWPPALVFILLLLSINAFFLMLALLMSRQDGRVVILLISMSLVLAGTIAMTITTERLWSRPTAVVRADSAPLRKIPGPLATDWIQLPAGSAVSIVAEEGSDILVRTGYGLEGWLSESSIIPVSEPFDGF